MGRLELCLIFTMFVLRSCEGNFYDDLAEAEAKANTEGCSADQGLEDWDAMAKDLEDAVLGLTGVLDNAASMFGGNKNCKFQCPDGKKAVHNVKHKPTFNGCGTSSVGVQVKDLFVPSFTQCCNKHDLCYDTCNTGKKKCDNEFGECLKNACSKLIDDDVELLEECNMMGEILHKGVDVLGCGSYVDSQKNACICE